MATFVAAMTKSMVVMIAVALIIVMANIVYPFLGGVRRTSQADLGLLPL